MKTTMQDAAQNKPTRFMSLNTFAHFERFKLGFVELLLLLLLVSVPFLVPTHAYPLTSFWLEYFSFLIFTIFLLVFSRQKLSTDQPVLQLHCVSLGLLAISVLTIIQASRGMFIFNEQLYWPMIYFTTGFVALSVGIRMASDAISIQKIFSVGLLLAWLSNFMLVNLQNLGWNFTGSTFVFFDNFGNTPGGFLSQRNQQATLAMVAWVALMMPNTRKWLPKAMFWVCYFLIPATVVLTKSRNGLAILLVLVVIFLLAYYRGNIKGVNKRYPLLVLGVLILYIGQTIAFRHLGVLPDDGRGDALSRSGNVEEYYTRYYTQLDAINMLKQKPLLGVGAGNFLGERYNTGSISAVGTGFNVQSNIAHTHNLFTQILVEWGVLGFLCIFIPVFIWVASIIRRWWRKELQETHLFAIGVMAAIGVYSMFEYPLWYGFFLIPFMLLMGLSGGGVVSFQLGKAYQSVKKCFTTLWIGSFLSVIAIALCLWIGKDYGHTEDMFSYRVYASYFAQKGIVLKRKDLEDALKTPFFNTEKSYLLSGMLEPVQPRLKEKTQLVETVSKRLPYPDVINRLIIFYVVEGRTDEAVQHALKLRKWDEPRYNELYQVISRNALMFGGKFIDVLATLPAPK